MAVSYVSPQERREYGTEALSVVGRRAREVLEPALQHLSQQNQYLTQRVQQMQNRDVLHMLDQNAKGWRETNRSPEWLAWLAQRHDLTGLPKQTLLDRAFNNGNASVIIQMLHDFEAEHGGGGQQPRPRSRSSSAWSTAGSQRASDKPSFSRSQIEKFYEDVRKQRYNEADKNKIEAQIIAAAREGRVTN
jgi:hypothetical protein